MTIVIQFVSELSASAFDNSFTSSFCQNQVYLLLWKNDGNEFSTGRHNSENCEVIEFIIKKKFLICFIFF